MWSTIGGEILVQRVNILAAWYWNYVAPNWRVALFRAAQFPLALAQFARKNRIVCESV